MELCSQQNAAKQPRIPFASMTALHPLGSLNYLEVCLELLSCVKTNDGPIKYKLDGMLLLNAVVAMLIKLWPCHTHTITPPPPWFTVGTTERFHKLILHKSL